MTESERNEFKAQIEAKVSRRALLAVVLAFTGGGFGGLLVGHHNMGWMASTPDAIAYRYESQLLRWQDWAEDVARALPPADHPDIWARAPGGEATRRAVKW